MGEYYLECGPEDTKPELTEVINFIHNPIFTSSIINGENINSFIIFGSFLATLILSNFAYKSKGYYKYFYGLFAFLFFMFFILLFSGIFNFYNRKKNISDTRKIGQKGISGSRNVGQKAIAGSRNVGQKAIAGSRNVGQQAIS